MIFPILVITQAVRGQAMLLDDGREGLSNSNDNDVIDEVTNHLM